MPRFPTRSALALLGALALPCLTACAPTATVSVSPTATPTSAPMVTPIVSPVRTQVSGAPQWIPLKSNAPADVLAAVKESTLFSLNCPPGGDCQQDLTRLGTPALVTELRTQPPSVATDFYIIPILDASGDVNAVAAAELNAAHSAIHVQGISGSGPRWPNLVTSDEAVAIVQAQHHIGPRSGTSPQLVWLPFDSTVLETGQIVWGAGGKGPQDPVWLIPGADGKDHVVGTDGRAYYPSEIPLA